MKFLKAATDNSLAARGLKYRLHKTLRRAQPARSMKVVHASSLTMTGKKRFCARHYAIMDKIYHTLPKPPMEFLSTSESVTFELGKMLQDYVINVLSDEGAAVTNWKCLNCGTMHDRCKRPVKCVSCQCTALRPDEIRLVSAETGVSCGFDLFADLGDNYLRITEVKSIDKEEFKKLVAPMTEHRIRTKMYMQIAEQSNDPWKGRINTSKANILYISKGGYGTLDNGLGAWGVGDKFSPFKEFVIHRDDKETEPYMASAKRLKDFRDGVKGMPCGVCDTAFEQRAQACPVQKQCFSGEFPPVE